MRVRVALLAALAAFMAVAGQAQAAPLTMGQLLVRCQHLDVSKDNEVILRSSAVGDVLDAGKCFGHLEAYLDLATIVLHDPDNPKPVHPLLACPPPAEQLNFTKMIGIFLDYARNHPQEREYPAASMVAYMLAKKFPCHK
jgi:Rap1a immunity proteins